MTVRPILFSAPMVRALIDGRKTQTRRALSRSWPVLGSSWAHKSAPWEGLDFDRAVARGVSTLAVALVGKDEAWPDPHLDVPFVHPEDAARGATWEEDQCWYRVRPPFAVGDRLWVKERCFIPPETITDRDLREGADTWPDFIYAADDLEGGQDMVERCGWRHRVSIHMPRKASRLTLTVTEVRVQRLQECSEEDCIAEGAKLKGWMEGLGRPLDGWMVETEHPHVSVTPRFWYRELWDTINGAGSWDANPWIVAVSFSVAQQNIDSS